MNISLAADDAGGRCCFVAMVEGDQVWIRAGLLPSSFS